MEPSQASGDLQSRKMTAFSKYHFQNTCHFQNLPTSARVALLSWKGSPPQALHSSFLHHAVQEGGKKKNHNIPHTFLGSLFSLSRIKCCWHLSPRFPEWAWRQNYADSQTHTSSLLHSPALCCQLTASFPFFPRVHLPIKGDWEKQLKFMVLSCLVTWKKPAPYPLSEGGVLCKTASNAK